MLRTTLTNLRARKLRVLATSLAVLLGVAFMSGTMVLSDTMGRSFDELVEEVYADTSAVVRGEAAFDSPDPFGAPSRPLVEETLVDEVAAIDGVVAAFGLVEGYAQIVGTDGRPLGDPGMAAPTFGVAWPENDLFNPLTVIDGRGPRSGDEAVIDKASADAGDLSVGDTTIVLTAAGPSPITIVGIARWGDADSPLGASITAFTPTYAQELLASPGRVNQVQVVAADGISEEEVRDRVATIVPDGLEVVTGAGIVAEEQGEIRELISFFGTFMLTFAIVALFVGSFIIYNTFSILVAQRNREMALLRALGASRRQVLGALLLEAAVVGAIASVLGLVAGVGVARLLEALLAGLGMEVPAGGVVVTAGTVAAAVFAGLVVSVAAAVIPARRASRIPPVAAMTDVDASRGTRVRLRTVVGSGGVAAGVGLISIGLFALDDNEAVPVGLGAAVLFVGVAVLGPLIVRPAARALGVPLARFGGVTGMLARENARRSPKRTASTASALMVGVALVGFITIFAASAQASLDDMIDRSFRGDFIIDSGTLGAGGFDPVLTEDLRSLDEVAAASGARVAPAEVDESVVQLLAVDPSVIDDVFDVGVVAGSLDGLDAEGIAVWDDKAVEEGWEVGDAVTVRFAETGVQEFRIAVLFDNRELVGTTYAMGIEAFDANLRVQLDTSIFVAASPGVPSAEARSAIEELTDRYPTASVLDQTEYKQTQASSFNQLLGLVYVLLLLAVLIALLGIANTLALSILERTRELGLLRAVGMTRAQMRATVRWESVIIAVFGALLGLVIGVFFGWAMVTALAGERISRFVVPVGPMLAIVVLAGLAGVLAAVVPARRAARTDVLA
ncbi:MAG: ABC transporter permease, partial [Acidimicrobiales bacterium]